MSSGADRETPQVVIQEDGRHWRYTGLVEVVETRHPAEVTPCLERIEQAVNTRGLFAAGYMAYEAAAAFGLATHDPAAEDLPLLWFGLFEGREPVDIGWEAGPFSFGAWQPFASEEQYCTAVEAVKEAIAAGNTYQANLTFHLQASFEGDPWALYVALCRAQRAKYTAYLDLGRHVICSASPELFFRRDGAQIVSRPMKGTAPRGLTLRDDRAQIEWLRTSEKNRAENVMIVDMIRNDFGRVATVGSVHVPELFNIERYPTLLQMTSTVTAETTVGLPELMRSMFPCASITGAPKVRTMQLLRKLEDGPRGVYTGAIGIVCPDGTAQFSVAIRTALIDREGGTAHYGVGSGIIWDSNPAAEYAECLLKARVLNTANSYPADFSLLESLRWTPEEGYRLLERHLARLADSAEYFDIAIDPEEMADRLARFASGLSDPQKVRLLVAQDGRITVESDALGRGQPPMPLRLGLALGPVSSNDKWLYHKTTVRTAYEQALAGRPDCDDVVLYNEKLEVTETSRANLVVEIDGRRLTPPVASGLLAGTARAELLERGELTEGVVMIDDLRRAARIWILNSVRGLLPAVLVG